MFLSLNESHFSILEEKYSAEWEIHQRSEDSRGGKIERKINTVSSIIIMFQYIVF